MDHYYGDTVRAAFIIGAIIMAATLPFFTKNIHEPLMVSIVAIILVSIAAGLTSPRYFWSAIVNVFISVSAVVMFEYYAVDSYVRFGAQEIFFWVNQSLSLIFLIAFYFALKTMRGMSRKKIDE